MSPVPAPALAVRKMKPMSDSSPTPQVAIDAYYDSTRRVYLVKDHAGDWMSVDKESIKARLQKLGFRSRLSQGETISQTDNEILKIQEHRNINYSCALAGFKRGVHDINGSKVLITRSPQIILSAPGEWNMLHALVSNQLQPRTPQEPPQDHYFHSWLKLADSQLQDCYNTGHVTCGQALFLIGPRGCGKSLLQLLIGEILGGRTAAPFHFMSGVTPFNSELFTAEHQMIEDEQPHKDMKSRVRFEDAIKQVTANIKKPCYGKGKEGLMLTPFWRLTHSANDEPDHLEVLPPFEDSLRDKVILLHCRKEPMPMPAATGEEKAAFWQRLMSEIPAYLHWLRNTYTIPEEIRDTSRYGVKAFFHPYVMTLLNDIAPETRLVALIDQIVFMDNVNPWTGTSEELMRVLHESTSYGSQAKTFLTSSVTVGKMLGKLTRDRSERFQEKRTSQSRDWIIQPPATPVGRPKPIAPLLDPNTIL